MPSSSKMVVNRYNFFHGTINPKERRHQKNLVINKDVTGYQIGRIFGGLGARLDTGFPAETG